MRRPERRGTRDRGSTNPIRAMPGSTPSIRRLILRQSWLVASAFGVLVVAALATLTVTLDVVHETHTETIEELQPVHRLQLALARFDRHIHHYLLDPSAEHLRAISSSRTATDRAFRALDPAAFNDPAEAEALAAAHRAWRQAKQETGQILAAGKSSQGERALAAMERIMGLLHRALDAFDRLYQTAYREVEAEHRRADTATRHGLAFIGLTALLGVGAVFHAARSMRRRLLQPLRGLEESARRLGGGELEHRAEVVYRDEFGHLARTFNEMAGRLQRHRAELTERAVRDPLTGLDNREELFRRLEKESARALRYGHALSVAMFDLDRFKGVNDRYGHAVGDQVLEAFARVIRDSLRRGDSAGRYGGEEFVVVLPETDGEAALEAATRIRRAFAGTQVPLPSGGSLQVTVSVGVATSLPGRPLSRQLLLEHADQALYAAKAGGRDRVAAA